MNWTQLNWDTLARLRDGFLSGNAARGPYWTSLNDLANYDLTYGERIGWKWDALLRELRIRAWSPPRTTVLRSHHGCAPTGEAVGGEVGEATTTILDWGCGSGIAGRRVLQAFGADHFSALHVWDHSPLACDFAIEAAQRAFPALKAERYAPGKPVGLLVLSHVINELPTAARAELLAVANQADAVLWVEPGTHAVSRDLATLRDQLRERFDLVAPCTHVNNCPLMDVENARHWCHFFAAAPGGIYADPDWVRFGQQAGVDLRSLPYSYLVLEKKGLRPAAVPLPADASRLIGRPRVHKAHIDLLACDNTGLNDLKLFKRTDPALYKQLDRKPPLPLYHWQREGEKITAIKPLFPQA